jgi:hypothetical protein
MTRIPRDQVPGFLLWAASLEAPPAAPFDQEINDLAIELVRVLESEPDNRLANQVLQVMNCDDLSIPVVSALYARWCATGQPRVNRP